MREVTQYLTSISINSIIPCVQARENIECINVIELGKLFDGHLGYLIFTMHRYRKWILYIVYNITCFRNQNDYYKDPIVTKISKFEDTKIPFLITRFFQRCSLKQILLLSFIAYHKPYAVMFYCKTSRIWKIISVSILSIC